MDNCCNNPKVKDLSQGLGDSRHWFCVSCKSHNYDGKQYTKTEWEEYVNSEGEM